MKNPGNFGWMVLACWLVMTGRPETMAQVTRPGDKVGSRPNIILILADDLGYGETGCYGQQKIRTPHIDNLAAQGIRFTRFYAASPVCAPSRCCLMTGLHTGHAYIRENEEIGKWEDYEGQLPLPENTETIATMLRQSGYHTAVIGKWGLGGPGTTGVPTKQGFDYFYGYLCQRQAHNHYPSYLWRIEEKVNLNNPELMPHQKFVEAPMNHDAYDAFRGKEFSTDLFTREAMDFIKAQEGNPFFLYLAYTLPHLALQVPERYLDPYLGEWDEKPYLGQWGYLPNPMPRATYAAMVSALDDQVGMIMQQLADLKIDSNTIVIFTSDNGATFEVGGADPAFFRSNSGLRGAKGSLYEGGIRVPMIARWPGQIRAGDTTGMVCAGWDLMPTLADLAGTPAPTGIDGISLAPTLLGKEGQRQHPYLYWEFAGRMGMQAVMTGNMKGIKRNIIPEPGRKWELYDLGADPAESVNIARKNTVVVAKIREIAKTRTQAIFPEWNFTPVLKEPGK